MPTDDHQKPPKVAPKVKSAPKIRQMYWCDFPKDAQLPEFWKNRPVLVISYRHFLSGVATVVPITTNPQEGNKWAFPMKSSFNNKNSWAICDKITTVAVSRLTPDKPVIMRVPEEEFNEILALVLDWLPKMPN
ncbi:MAG: type II toxin-antitoxin system PemK/MazF family toxin [Flavobacteriaceae bacterium]|nr:type II toxin-antitoxin system PemK/MazF family toxin [Flavobacteriaceae bacterium]